MTTPVTESGEPKDSVWVEGWKCGFYGDYIEPWRLRSYSDSFVRGYKTGKAEIDELVEAAERERQTYGEWK